MKRSLITQIVFGGLIFIPLFAVSFGISNGQVNFLIHSPLHWLIELSSVLAIGLVGLAIYRLSSKQLLGLTLTYALTPLAFQFGTSQSIQFIFWQKAPFVIVCFWLIATGLLSRYLLSRRQPNSE
ncbi:hypothetical protein [uncultured Microscilla sp.]|uniref:hypothetical protein n=1 Tax=uncultured Microscilla sp. TaxID=432653 RepID=UPI002602F30D|nr:hypothetical protein [uncultured Microscilla sp.]